LEVDDEDGLDLHRGNDNKGIMNDKSQC